MQTPQKDTFGEIWVFKERIQLKVYLIIVIPYFIDK
jgi:hypothetical protein